MKRSYSRRELYALGEPLGDSATYRKAGGLVLGDGGGGGGAAPAPDKTTQVTELPAWARPYAKDTLAKGAALTDINQNPYQTYGANRIAGFSPLQERSFLGAANMQPSQQLGTGTDLATAAGIGALGTNYQAGRFTNQFQDPGQYQPGQFSMSQVEAPNLQNFQMGPAERVRTQSFTRPGSAEQYMSPYMQNVVDIQKREAQRQSGIQGTQQQAQAVGAGAFGGSRDAIMRAERERNLGQQMGDIQATGSQAAFQQAQQQFNAEQQARLQAQQANQQAGLTVGGQNLAALLGVQQLGAGQNLQSQLANQQTFQQAQRDAEQSRQFGAGQGLQAAGLGAQYGQAAQQMGEQSRQYGAGLGMQGLQTALQGAGQLGQLGGQQFQQGMDINKLQSAYGGQMQQQAQRPLDMAYQDFLNQQNYPYKQLGFMSDLVRGLPLGQQSTSSIYEQGPGMTQTLAGLGGAAYGFGKSGLFGKEGGLMTSYAGGGVTSQDNKDSIVEGMYSMEGLQKAKEAALARRDVDTAEAIDERIAQLNALQAQNASIDRGLGSAFDQIPPEQQEEMMAGGGIVAFAGGGTYKKQAEDAMSGLEGLIKKYPTAQTPEEYESAVTKRIPMVEKIYGPDVTLPYLEETKAKREKLPEQMEKDQGLAFAARSLGLLARKKRPGESQKSQLIAGLGEAGQEFAGDVGRLKKESREADDKLRQSEITLTTAQQARKEGLVGRAMGLEDKARAEALDGYKSHMNVQEKLATIKSRLAGTEMQGENALRVAGVQAGSHLAAARINKEAGATADRQIAALAADIKRQNPNMSPAEINARATKEFLNLSGRYPGASKEDLDRQTLELKKVELAGKDWKAAMMNPKDPVYKQVKQLNAADPTGAAAEDYKRRWIAERASGAGSSTPAPTDQPAPNVPGSTGTPSRSGRQLSAVDKQALEWAKSNPDDPRAEAIRQRLGMGG